MGNQLTGKRALVVGASRGMGRAVAEAYADAGASVAVAARSRDELEELSSNIDGQSVPIECDLREMDSVERAVEQTVDTFGGIDVVFNSAGTLARNRITEATMDEMETVVDVNLLGAIRLSKAVIPELSKTDGVLLHVSSEAAEKGVPNLPAYCASKGGLNALVRQLAIEYGEDNVRVNGIAPGTTKTSLNEEVRREDPEWVTERQQKIPLGRLGTTEDICGLAVFLASEGADYITGETIGIDGGTTA